MKKVQYFGYYLAIISVLSIGLTGCGGGGSTAATEPTEPNTNQYDLRTWVDTAAYTINGEGTISSPAGTLNVTGTYQSTYQGTSTAPTGETVHDHDVTMILTAGATTVTQFASSATYEGNIVYVDNITEGVVCETPLVLAGITPVPTDAQVGYISAEIPLSCSDGTYITNVMKLTDAGGGNAEMSIISNVYTTQGGTLLSSETDNIVVTPTMSMVNAEITGSIPADGITFVLSSTSIVQN